MPGQSSRARTKSKAKIHVHIENVSTYTAHTQVQARHLADAARRHPEIADRIRTTVSWDYEKFDRHMRSAEILVFMGLDLGTKGFAARTPKLEWIQLTCAGVDHITPFDWLPDRVAVANNSGVHGEKLGEFALTGVLMLNQFIPAIVTHQRKAEWHRMFGTVIAGKTLAVIGVGSIGGAAAAKAKGLGMHVIGIRRDGKPHRAVDEMYKPRDLRRVLGQADFVLVALPFTPETRHLIDKRAIGWMRKGAGIVNVGRGATIDYRAMADALISGHLSGAVLDAYEEEPLPSSSFLWNTPNLILSPHCSSSDVERYIPLTLDIAYRNLGRYISGKPLLNQIDRSLGY